MRRSKGNILNKLHIFKTNFYIFVLEILYRAHIHIRYLHDKVYQRGGTYKKYSDSSVSTYVHRASMLAFVFSFIVFQFMQNIWPYMFTFKPREVQASQNTATWTSYNDFNNNNGATGATTRSQATLNGSGTPNDAGAGNLQLTANTGTVTPDFGDGSDGALTVTSGTTTINTTKTTLSANATNGTTSITVTDATGFVANQKILIIQMKDANGSTYSQMTGTWSAGQDIQEERQIQSVVGNSINLTSALSRPNITSQIYNYPATYTQIVKIMQYTNVTISGSGTTVTAPAYDGSTGGILSFKVSGTVNIGTGAKIDMGERGYRGINLSAGEGPGGAPYNNTGCSFGSGGGGYGGNGGQGGSSGTCGGVGEVGGGTYGPHVAMPIMGSGGGSGWSLFNGAAGNGGGLIKIQSTSFSISGEIKSNGGYGNSATGDCNGGCANGGGSGGGIHLVSSNNVNSGVVNVSGGNAASNGGAGGGGRITIQSPYVNANYNVNGGNSAGAYGAQNGVSGAFVSLTPYQTPGTIGGSGASDIGLRKDAGAGLKAKWSSVAFNSSALAANQAIKFAVRTSDDGTTWSALKGKDGNAINWTTGTGNYLGQAYGESIYSSISGISPTRYIDIVVQMESLGGDTPTLNDVTLNYDTLDTPSSPKQFDSEKEISVGTSNNYTNESSATLKATVSGIDSGDLTPEFEVNTDNVFEGTASAPTGVTATPSNVSYAGTPISDATVGTLSGLSANTYYWKVRLSDGAGRVSAWSSAQNFSVDQSPPTGMVSIDGGTYTADITPDLTLSASDTGGSGLSQMRFSNDGATWSGWEAYTTTRANWNVTSGYGATIGDGDKTVYAQFKDNAGNVTGWEQTDWSGGTGQTQWSDTLPGPTKFDTQSNVNYSSSGQIVLSQGPRTETVNYTGISVTSSCNSGLQTSTVNKAWASQVNSIVWSYSNTSASGMACDGYSTTSIFVNNVLVASSQDGVGSNVTVNGPWSGNSIYGTADAGGYGGTVTINQATYYGANVYYGSGDLVSSVKDLGSNSRFSGINWDATTQTNSTLTIKVQAGANNNPDTDSDTVDGTNWTRWYSYTTTGSNLDSAFNGKRYVRYKVSLTSEDGAAFSTLREISIGFMPSAFITLDTTAPVVPRDNISDPASFPANNTLRAPNGGESWGGGTLKTIVWNSDNVSDGTGSGLPATPVNLYYSGSGSAPWTVIASNLTNGANSANGGCTPDAGTGCYAWRLPNTIDSTNMKVKVEFVDTVGNKVDYNNDAAQNADTSDTVFSSTSDSTPPTAFTISGSSPDNNDWTDATPDISWSASSDPESGPVIYELWMTQTSTPTYPTDFVKRTDVGSAGTINVTNATPTLTGLEGSWYYFVRATNGAYDAGDPNTYRDVGYGIGGDTTHYFRVDDTKPTGTLTIKVLMSSETDATNSYQVDLALTQSDGTGSGTTLVKFKNDAGFYCNYSAYSSFVANFDLRDDCAGQTNLNSRGSRTVTMVLKDATGNESNVVTDTIIYDVTNPNIPASVASSVQGTVVSGITNTIRVTWTDIADPAEATETVSGIDGYNVYRSDSFNPPYTKINGSLVAPGTLLYDDATTTDGVTYNYKVEAVDNAGNTNTNNTATSQSLSDKTAPSDVSSFTAGGTDDTTIGLTWNSTSDNAAANGGKANKYYIQRTGALGGTEPVIAGSDPSFTYSALVTVNFEQAGKYDSGTDTYIHMDNVSAQQWYYYKIKAEDSASPTPYQSSGWIYFKSRGNFAPAFNLNDIVVTANNGHTKDTAAPGDIMNFSFPVTDADGAGDLNVGTGNALETIRIVDALFGESLAATQVTSKIQNVANGYTFSYNYTVPSATPYGTYTATLRVKDSVAVDGSTHDISRNVNFKVIPEKPTGLTVTGTNSTTLNVSWTAPGNAGNRTGLRATNTYSVRRADTSGGTYSHIGYTTSSSYADNGLTMNEDYYYKVVAFDVSNNEGVLSDISGTSGTTTPTPAVPQASSVKMIDASTVDEGQNRFLLVWGDPTADPNNNTTTANFANYVVEKAENCANNIGSCIFSNAGETTNKYFVDVSLSNTTDYTYRIHVKDSFANLSRNDISPVKEGKPGAKPSVSIVSESTGVSTARVKWTATQEAETQVVYSTNQSQLNDANAKVNIAGIGGRRLAGEEHDVNLVGLSPNTTYYYKIVSRNQLGFANDVAVRTIKTQDFTIQNISNVTTTTTATVHWTTNIDADSNVEYKKEARIGESAEESKTAGDPKLTKDHEVVIKALKPDTNYTYKIRSVTSDKFISETQFLTFKTKPYDASQFTITPNASSIAEQNITATSAKIVWNTAVATTSWLDYGTSAGVYNQSAGDNNFNTVHVVELVNLTPGTTYFYKVRGKDTNEIEYTSKEYSFTAVLLPQILNPKTSGLTSYTISMDWETNVSATSFVAFGKDATYGSGVGKTEPSKVHSIKLKDLEDNTTYHYQITVKDQFGNEAKSADLTFATPIDTTGPEVKEVKIDILPMGTDDETASAIISWTTSKPATTQIDYDEGVIGGKYSMHSIEDKNLNGAHTVIVKDLNPSTTYHFRIVSKDKRGNTGNSQDYNFVTPTKEKSILQLIIRSLEETFSWVSQMPRYFRGLGNKIIGR